MVATEFNISGFARDSGGPGAYPWYGIRTRPNHEKTAARILSGKGYESYLPLCRFGQRKRSGGESERPLFPGYVFCRFDAKARLPVLITAGVISVIGCGNEPAPIPEEEIETIKTVLRSGALAESCPFLHEGQRVRVTHGSLEGIEGILIKKKNQCRMVISVHMLQRSISVEIEGHRLAAL